MAGIPAELPEPRPLDESVPHAPARPKVTEILTPTEIGVALANALRYFPVEWHEALAPEFLQELKAYGRIYMMRFRPDYEMYARPIEEYPGLCDQTKAIMHMIQNNLDPKVAQFPHELITYGGNGTVFQNWAQYLLTMQYLANMRGDQTLILYSGHPMGLFPSSPDSPRVVLTNGMVVPNYSSREQYDKLAALGVTSYGQMTAGSFMYIGPQGIVHGTTITLLNAGRKYLGLKPEESLAGKVFVTSGLGGMSGAQAKAAVIAGAVGVIAEINPAALNKRLDQGWLDEATDNLDVLISRIQEAVSNKEAMSLGYLGNIVDLWKALYDAEVHVDLGSDQTSLHNPHGGGYYPAGMSLEKANAMMVENPKKFKRAVTSSLRAHAMYIHHMVDRGMYFWDYGNAFLLEAKKAGAMVMNEEGTAFLWPSYVEDIMGPMCFDYGFGPFRWVCCSGDPDDLEVTDSIAYSVIAGLADKAGPEIKQQYLDNLKWIQEAGGHKMDVGSKARILYSDRQGRIAIALAFNQAVKDGLLSGPVVIGRDHHDVSGTDSPYRETANIRDGSMFCADMAIHNVIGDAMRGATWVSIHNGGGVGWGEVINGGFGLVLDGTPEAARRAKDMLGWDVGNGLARRAWAGNPGAKYAVQQAMNMDPDMQVTMAQAANPDLVSGAINKVFG